MSQEIPQNLDRVIHVDCHACGSEMVFDAAKGELVCKHCGNTRPLPKDSDMVVEVDFNEGVSSAGMDTGFATPTKTFHCNACGANTAVEPDTVKFNCPFCGSENVNEEAHASRAVRPAGILPFKVNKEGATEKFKAWIKRGLFAPNNLKKIARLNSLRGVYVPFWTYDAETRSNWWADAGYYYYTTETYTDNNGQTRTKQVRHTQWVPASGYYEHDFDDVLVIGSKGISQSRIEKIYPYELEGSVNYDPRYILGFDSEVYQLDVQKGYEVADGIMDAHIRAECARRVPGDTHRNLRVNTHKGNITFKHLLLPVWVAGYTYNNKVFQFVVNGQSGKASGSKPVSFWKVLIAIGIGAAIIAGLYFLLSSGKGGDVN